MSAGLVNSQVIHHRYRPKEYRFSLKFFWFKFDLMKPDELFRNPLVSHNKFNLYSFYDKDHIKLEASAKDSYIKFLKEHGVTQEIKELTIYTNLRFLGYVFNPVSFILAKDHKEKQYGIIEIGNTFNELKPYFIASECFTDQEISFESKKLFYISPFIRLDSTMKFTIKRKKENIAINIHDFDEDGKILDTFTQGKEKKLSSAQLILNTLRHPFITLKVIGLIHWHALVLWLKKVPFLKKTDHPELQQGSMTWKE